MTINQDCLDDFDKFLPEINKTEEIEPTTIAEAVALGYTPMTLSASSSSPNAYVDDNIQAHLTKKGAEMIAAEMDKRFKENVLATNPSPVVVRNVCNNWNDLVTCDDEDIIAMDNIPTLKVDAAIYDYALSETQILNHYDGTVSPYDIAYAEPNSMICLKNKNDDWSVNIDIDGTIKFSGDIKLSQAAKEFWNAVCRYAPENQHTIDNLEREVAELKAKLSDLETEKSENVCENQIAFGFETPHYCQDLKAYVDLQHKITDTFKVPTTYLPGKCQSVFDVINTRHRDSSQKLTVKWEINDLIDNLADTDNTNRFDDAMEMLK